MHRIYLPFLFLISTCQQTFRGSSALDQPPNDFTPAMEEVMKKRLATHRRHSSESDAFSGSSYSLSPELFDSEEDFDPDEGDNNTTVYYSPCGSTSPTADCTNHKHNKMAAAAKVPLRSYSSRRVSSSSK